jgi:hypothetical protein
MSLGGIPNPSAPGAYMPVLVPISKRTPLQRWTALRYPEDEAADRPTFWFRADFVEPIYGIQQQWVPMFTGNHNADISLQDPRNMSTRSFWNLIAYGDFFCLQNNDDQNQNLNAAGNGPYPENTRVLAYTWSHGSPNEIWKFVEFD